MTCRLTRTVIPALVVDAVVAVLIDRGSGGVIAGPLVGALLLGRPPGRAMTWRTGPSPGPDGVDDDRAPDELVHA